MSRYFLTNFVGLTVESVSQEDPAHPATNSPVYDTDAPLFWGYRSTDALTQNIVYQLSTQPVVCVAVFNVNSATLTLETGPSNTGPWTAVGGAEVPVFFPAAGRYNYYWVPSSPITDLFLRLTMGAGTLDGAAYHQVGLITAHQAGSVFPRQILAGATRQSVNKVLSGESGWAISLSPPAAKKQVQETWPFKWNHQDSYQLMSQVTALGPDDLFVTFDTDQPTGEILLARYADDPTITLGAAEHDTSYEIQERA